MTARHAHERDLWLTYMILVSYSLVTASKRDNEQDLWLSYMITAMYCTLVAASKRDWELVPPLNQNACIGARFYRTVKRERATDCTLASLCTVWV